MRTEIICSPLSGSDVAEINYKPWRKFSCDFKKKLELKQRRSCIIYKEYHKQTNWYIVWVGHYKILINLN